MHYPNSFTKLTKEYVGGILSGIGLGMYLVIIFLPLTELQLTPTTALISGAVFMVIGSALARYEQRKLTKVSVLPKVER